MRMSKASVNVHTNGSGEVSQRQAGSRLGGRVRTVSGATYELSKSSGA